MAVAPRWTQDEFLHIFDLSHGTGSDVQSFLSNTLAVCTSWFQASGGSVFLGDKKSGYSLRATAGAQKSLPRDAHVTHGQGIAGVVAKTGRGRIIDDPSLAPELKQAARNRAIGSAIVVPLIDQGKGTIGVLNISRVRGEKPFGAQDLDQASAVAAHLSLAICNASLVDSLQQTVEQTRMEREKLSAVLDSVAGAVVVFGPDGSVLNANQAASGAEFLNAGPDSDFVTLGAELRRVTADLIERGTGNRIRAHDEASDRTWFVESTPLSTGGGVVTVQEITEHERQSRELARTRRLAEIGQMTASIAHEIRNPLTGIRTAAQMISQHPETLADFIGTIEEEAMRLNALCDEFLEFARPMQVHASPQRLADSVGKVVKLLSPQFLQKQVVLNLLIEGEQPTINLDARRVEQVVHNLLRNALEASLAGGTVVCRVSGHRLSVEDDGCGMEPQDLERLFSPFFTTKPDGTGLGLCTARKIVDAHGGEITATSSVGVGTTVTMTLGLNQP